MTPPAALPVSTALEADLRATVRKHGVVVWLDADGHYAGFVDRLMAARASQPEAVPFAVLAYRGSFLELMLRAEGLAEGVERTALVVHLPRFTEDRVKASPMLELYAAGVRYRKGLDTLVTEAAAGRVPPETIRAFLAEPDLSLERADAWLAALLGGGLVAGRVAPPSGREAPELRVLWELLAARTGITAAWRTQAISTKNIRAEYIAFAVCSWALGVEYVYDLGRPPVGALLLPMVGLPGAVVAACCALAVHLRERYARAYTRWADETELWLADEVAVAKPRDLGRIDTLRFEEDIVLLGALDAMGAEPEDWALVLAWAEPRIKGASFWVHQDEYRLASWQLIAAAARLGRAIEGAGPRLLPSRGGPVGLSAASSATSRSALRSIRPTGTWSRRAPPAVTPPWPSATLCAPG